MNPGHKAIRNFDFKFAQQRFSIISVRYFLRLLVCPNKSKFLTDKMNLVDLIGIIPTIFSIILAGLENMKIIGQARNLLLHRLVIGLDMD